ncbi:MAG: hypothetical protein ACM3TT_08920 [Syntrophothermus sp.]
MFRKLVTPQGGTMYFFSAAKGDGQEHHLRRDRCVAGRGRF